MITLRRVSTSIYYYFYYILHVVRIHCQARRQTYYRRVQFHKMRLIYWSYLSVNVCSRRANDWRSCVSWRSRDVNAKDVVNRHLTHACSQRHCPVHTVSAGQSAADKISTSFCSISAFLPASHDSPLADAAEADCTVAASSVCRAVVLHICRIFTIP